MRNTVLKKFEFRCRLIMTYVVNDLSCEYKVFASEVFNQNNNLKLDFIKIVIKMISMSFFMNKNLSNN